MAKRKVFEGNLEIVPTKELNKGDIFTGVFDGTIAMVDPTTGEVKPGWARFMPAGKSDRKDYIKLPLSFQLSTFRFEVGQEYEIECVRKEGRMKVFDISVDE